MTSTRTDIRNLAADAAKEADHRLNTFAHKHITSSEIALPAAVIVMQTVDIEQDLRGGLTYQGLLSVVLMIEGDEVELDDYIDAVAASMYAKFNAEMPKSGCQWQALEYDREIDPSIAAAGMSWLITWT